MKTSKTLIYSVALIGLLSTFAQGATSTQLFFDDFTGTALDTSLWSVFVDKNGQSHKPYVAGGLLHSQGYHTRIDSISTFAPMGQCVIARARIRLAGELQKFGFAPNPWERVDNPYEEWDGPITGYYFDTVGSSVGYVRATAWFQPASGDFVTLLDVEIPVTWYEFHEFAIERTPSEVIYSIDGNEVARVADAFAGALPVGVWNDRWSLMQTDWVEVLTIPESVLVVEIDIKPGSYPNAINLGSHGLTPVAILSSDEGRGRGRGEEFDATSVDPNTVNLAGALVATRGKTGEKFMAHEEDVDGDGLVDLVVQVVTADINPALLQRDGDVIYAVLTGNTSGGEAIEGEDEIVIVPPK